MADHLDDEGCLRLLAAVVLQWWREADRIGESHELASFLGVPEREVRGVRPLRIDGWRRKALVGPRGGLEGDEDGVYF